MKIPDKQTFVALQRRGLLGNFLRSWPSFEAAYESLYYGWLTVRGVRPSFQHFVPEIHIAHRSSFLNRGIPLEDYYVQEIPPPGSGRLVNFEVCRLAPAGLTLIHGTLNTDQNLCHDLQQNGCERTGAVAQVLLRDWAGEDYDALEDIWARYPDCVIEATVFNRPVGEFSRRMVIWEARDF